MHIAIVAATSGEIAPFCKTWDSTRNELSVDLSFHETGVGMMAATFAITKLIYERKPDLIIQAGIAGAFATKVKLGAVVVVQEEILGNTGVEENNEWRDIFDLNLEKENIFPFEQRKLVNPSLCQYNLLQLPEVRGITVSEVTTASDRIALLQEKYAADIESMEGAAMHYVCKMNNVSFIQMRAISNYVGERDKSQWLLSESIHALNETLKNTISIFNTQCSISNESYTSF